MQVVLYELTMPDPPNQGEPWMRTPCWIGDIAEFWETNIESLQDDGFPTVEALARALESGPVSIEGFVGCAWEVEKAERDTIMGTEYLCQGCGGDGCEQCGGEGYSLQY